MSSAPNPLFGWQGLTGVNAPPGSSPFNATGNVNIAGPSAGSNPQNPFGQGVRGGGNQTYNLAETNLQTGLAKNQLINPFSQNFFGMGNQAGNFFNQLMNLGSPYYQQQQRASFEQGNQQGQNAAAQARQQLSSTGYGYTPSGAEAGMIGGMAQANAGNLNTTFLQNLFNNEQLQTQAAQGLAQLASLFNPSQLVTSSLNPNIQQPTNTGAETLGAVGQAASGIFGSSGIPK